MTRIDCNCIDGQTKIYLKNLILTDLDKAKTDMNTAIGLSKPYEVSTIMKSYESTTKNIKEILRQIEDIDVCKLPGFGSYG